MSTSTDKQDAQGRSWDQITKNGTSSAGSMGVGGTGDSGKLDRQGESRQQATRTDDLLTDGSDNDDTGAQGFAGSGQLQTGLEGMGKGGSAGNRQSGQGGAMNQQGMAERGEGGSAREEQGKR